MKHDKETLRRSQELRKNMTKEECHLWYDCLKDYPLQFRRQVPVGRYIVDFLCYKAKLIVELDGSQHYEPTNIKYDEVRTRFLEEQGYKVIRFANTDVKQHFRSVCEAIDLAVKSRV